MLEQKYIAELYERHGYFVHRRCVRLLGSRSEADDALQEVFIRAIRYGDGLRQDSPLPWLYGIANRVCFDILSKRKRFTSGERTEQVLRELEARPDTAEDPERVQLVGQVLVECKEKVREVAMLYYVDEMTQDEVAEAVGVSRKTVKERLAQFRDTARRMLNIRGGRNA